MNAFFHKYTSEAVGAAFFIIMISVAYFTMIKKNVTAVTEPVYMPVILESAESLKIGSNVTLLGVPIGIIGSLHYVILDRRGQAVVIERRKKITKREKPVSMVRGQFVIAVLDLTRDVEIYPNYTIVTQYPSLFSVKTVDIRPGQKLAKDVFLNVRYLRQEEVVALRTKQEIPHFVREDVVLQAENFGDPLFLLSEIIAENQVQIRRITHNFALLTDKLNSGRGNIALLLNQRGLERDAVDLLLQTSVLAEELGEGLEAFRETNSMIDSFKTLFFLLLAGI